MADECSMPFYKKKILSSKNSLDSTTIIDSCCACTNQLAYARNILQLYLYLYLLIVKWDLQSLTRSTATIHILNSV